MNIFYEPLFYLLFLSILILLYIFSKNKVFKLLGLKVHNFDLFIKDIKTYTQENFPYIKFDFYIIKRLSNEPNTIIKEIKIIENICEQFVLHPDIRPTPPVDSDKLWQTYILNSKPIRDKLPNDWQRRKEAIYKIENGQCQRCGKKTTPNNAYLNTRKAISKGGEYNIENLILTCSDCNILLNTPNQTNIIKRLEMYDFLLSMTTKE